MMRIHLSCISSSFHPAHQLFDKMSVRKFQKLVIVSFRTNYCPPFFSFSTCAESSDLKTPKSCGSVASFLKESGFSDTLLAKIEKTTPKLLKSKLEQTVKPKINFLKNMGLSKSQIANVVSRDPWILTQVSVQSYERSVKVLRKFLGGNLYDSRILNNFGWFLKYKLDKTLVPNVELMKSCGIEQSQILKLFYYCPKLLLLKAQTFKECVRRVDEMGVDKESRLYVYAIKTIGSMSLEIWEQKLDVFRGLGYTEVDIILTFRRLPIVFAVPERKIKRTAEFLLNTGKFDLSYVLRYPHTLMYSLERRLKPRLRELDILEREKLLEFKPNSTVFTCSNSKFFGKLVRPHLDKVEELSFAVKDAKP